MQVISARAHNVIRTQDIGTAVNPGSYTNLHRMVCSEWFPRLHGDVLQLLRHSFWSRLPFSGSSNHPNAPRSSTSDWPIFMSGASTPLRRRPLTGSGYPLSAYQHIKARAARASTICILVSSCLCVLLLNRSQSNPLHESYMTCEATKTWARFGRFHGGCCVN